MADDDSTTAHPLPGSERPPLAAVGGPLADDAPVEATLVLRRRGADPDTTTGIVPKADFADRFGADPADVTAVTSAIEAAGLTVVSADAASRRVRISGPAAAMNAAFGTRLHTTETPGATRARSGGLSVPAALAGVVTAVLGLDDRNQAASRTSRPIPGVDGGGFTPPELGAIYRFPANTDGTGQTVAILELGGGFAQDDLDAYFGGLNIPTPEVTAVGVDGGTNVPGQDPDGADGEVLLDIEVVGALAPGAELLVYFAPNTDAGFLDALSQAAHATPTPAAISISWGQSEDEWTEQARTAFDQALADAATLGVVVTAAAGDDGSTDRATDGKSHADFPASSPHALACGGTKLVAEGGTVTSEVVWNNGAGKGATGGGVSDAFPLPDWQKNVGVPALEGGATGRGVPDVAAVADPQTGYRIRVDGKDIVIGGTSAVSPLWAALVARIVQSTGKPLGLLAQTLYGATAAGATPTGFRDITEGTNGAYQAGPGWDACTGLGVPDGTALLAALGGTAQ